MAFVVRECPGNQYSVTGLDEFDQPIGTWAELLEFARSVLAVPMSPQRDVVVDVPLKPSGGRVRRGGKGNQGVLEGGQTLRQIADDAGLDWSTIKQRYMQGLRGADLRRPRSTLRKRRYTCREDRGQTLAEIADEMGVSVFVLRSRWLRGCRGDDLRAPLTLLIVTDDGRSLSELAADLGMSENAIRLRWARGDRGAVLVRPSRQRTTRSR